VIIKTYITLTPSRQYEAIEVIMLEPRLKSSVKWAPFPQELLGQIRKVFQDHFPEKKSLGEFVVEGRIYPEEILLRLGFLHKGWIRQNNYEVSSSLKTTKMSVLNCIHLCVDLAGTLFNENSSEEDQQIEHVNEWKPIQFEGHEFYYKFTTENSELEKQADKILGLEHSEELFNSPIEDLEELRTKIEGLGLLDDDDVEEDLKSNDDKKPNQTH
jgi:hypothetical protein